MTSCKSVNIVYNKNRQKELTTTKNQIKKEGINNMTYEKAKEIAKSARSYEEVDNFLKQIELDGNITDRQYYNLKHIAIDAAYEAMKKF